MRRINKHINDLSTGPTSTLSRVLAEAELDFAELEGYVSTNGFSLFIIIIIYEMLYMVSLLSIKIG